MAKDKLERISRLAPLARRSRDAHKGDFGHVLVIGGSGGMMGALALASNAALRCGAGLVTFAAPEAVQPYVATLCSCATSVALSNGPGALAQVAKAAGPCDVIAVGPGMGTGAIQREIVLWLIEQGKTVVIDADGLNNLCSIDGWPARRRCPLALTPHPGEFARLTGLSVAEIQSTREDVAVSAARRWVETAATGAGPLVCVLKGAGTVVTDGSRLYVNDTGNPGMATGGSGDVLTGLTAALIGQHLHPFEAACLAVRCHGRAGDLAAAELGETSLIASDLLDYLPKAMKEVVA